MKTGSCGNFILGLACDKKIYPRERNRKRITGDDALSKETRNRLCQRKSRSAKVLIGDQPNRNSPRIKQDNDSDILTFNVLINRGAINRGRARGAVSLIKLHSPLIVYK